MKTITRRDLKRLTEIFPVYNETQRKSVVGGKTGTEWWWDWMNAVTYASPESITQNYGSQGSVGNLIYSGSNYSSYQYSGTTGHSGPEGTVWYTQEQLVNWPGEWPGGYVEGWGYVEPDVVIYGSSGSYGSSGTSNSFGDGRFINQYHINGPKYIFAEGVGGNASCFLDGYVIQDGNDIKVWSSMSGAYIPQAHTSGIVELWVNGSLKQTKPLTLEPSIIYKTGTHPLGSADFNLSNYSGHIELKINCQYDINPGGIGYIGSTIDGVIYSANK
jgi:hypothetical protein